MKDKLYKISIILLLILLVAMFSACGSSGVFDKGTTDAVFSIMSNTEVTEEDNDFLRLVNIDGNTFDSVDGLSFEVEDPSVASITGTSGIIKSCEVDDVKSTNVVVSYGDTSTTIKVVVVPDESLEEYSDYDNVYIPYGLTSIDNSFEGSDIESLYIPSTVISIAPKAFHNCTELKEIYVNGRQKHISEACFKGCSLLEEVSLPDSLVLLDDSLFRQCSNLKHIDIPSNVQTIGEFCFFCDYSLEEIEIPDSVTLMKERTFTNCSSLKSAKLSSNLTEISDDSFASCSSLESVSFPNGLTSIGERAFLKCSNISELVLPNSLDSVGLDAFSNCNSITSISVPATFHPLEAAFNGVTRLMTVNITGEGESADYSSDNYTCSPWYSSRKNNITFNIAEGVTSIGDYTFVYCYGLKEITIPSSVVSIGRGAFRKCYNIETVNMPDSLTNIGVHAFSLCYSLKDIEFPKNLYSVGAYAFYYCSSFENIYLPDTVTKIGAGAFSACNNLKSITVGETSKSNLKTIGENTFAGLALNCSKIDITSKKIISIGDGAFGYYKNDHGLISMAKFAEGATFNINDKAIKHLRENVNYFSKPYNN